MGRIFETRKHTIFARNDRMSKLFTKYGKEIAIAVKAGGPDIAGNSRLRAAVQNAKAQNMPKDRIEAAIKRASSKDDKGLDEVIYEGYGPHGVAIMVETGTDNTTRTVANMRLIFNRGGGTLGTQGSVEFMFTRKGVFKFNPAGLNMDDLELELIDAGAEDMVKDDEGNITVYTAFSDYGKMQHFFEEKGIPMLNTELQRLPNAHTEGLTDEQVDEVLDLIAKLEDDDDVQKVFHSLA